MLSLFYLRNTYLFFTDMYRWEVFLLIKCQTSCKYMHSQSMMIRTMFTALSLFHSHWTPMGWCSFVWIKVPVGLVLCTIGDTKPSFQQRMTSEPQTQLGKYFSVSLNYCYAYNYLGQCGKALLISVQFKCCIFCGFPRKLCSANMILTQSAHTASVLKHILSCVVFMKLHPQEVFASNTKSMLTEDTVLKRDWNCQYCMHKWVGNLQTKEVENTTWEWEIILPITNTAVHCLLHVLENTRIPSI